MAIGTLLFSFLQGEEEVKIRITTSSLCETKEVGGRKSGITAENSHVTAIHRTCWSPQASAHINDQLPWAMESRMAPWLREESTTAPTASAPLRLLLNCVGKSILTFTHSGQFLFIYFWLSVSGMPLFLLMKYCFGLFIFRLTVWWRFIDPGIKVQAGKNCSKQTAWLSTPEYFSVSSYTLFYYLKFK